MALNNGLTVAVVASDGLWNISVTVSSSVFGCSWSPVVCINTLKAIHVQKLYCNSVCGECLSYRHEFVLSMYRYKLRQYDFRYKPLQMLLLFFFWNLHVFFVLNPTYFREEMPSCLLLSMSSHQQQASKQREPLWCLRSFSYGFTEGDKRCLPQGGRPVHVLFPPVN